MLLCPKTVSTLHRSLSPLRLFVFPACPVHVVTSPRRISLSSCAVARPLRSAAGLAVRAFSAAAAAAAAAAADPSAAAGEMAPITAVDHVVLFKVRDDTESAKISSMISNLRSLVSLDGVLHLHAGPILRLRSAAASSFGFTHLLHSRYRTKEDLAAYSASPAHVSVVREFVLPICEDIMAVDWVGEFASDPAAPPPGSAARVTLMKLVETAGDAGKGVVLGALGEAKGLVGGGGVEQLSYGENFSPARAKGFTIGSVAIFPGVEELDAVDGKSSDLMEAHKEKVRPLLESIIVLDFVVAPSPPAISGL